MSVWEEPAIEPEYPCIRRCGVSSRRGYCEACGMTIKDMLEWDQYSSLDKINAVRLIKERFKERNEV